MSESKTRKSIWNPEEEMREKFKAKCRFLAAVRRIIDNRVWMLQTEAKISVILLNLDDKILLFKPIRRRTEEDKTYLFQLIGGLKWYQRYPSTVRKKMAGATTLMCYEPGRVLARQNGEAHAMFFILQGEIKTSVNVFDGVLMKWVDEETGVIGPRNYFGETSLLHGLPRSKTYTTKTYIESLMLAKEDFSNILETEVEKQWNEVKSAMSRFTYFDEYDKVSLREASILAKMKNFAPHETIIGDGKGLKTHVYFMLSGRCQLIENFNIKKTTQIGKTFYKLAEPSEPHVKPIFMQVCLFNAGSCFGLGEPMENRRIIALTPVECMLLPHLWLLQRNTACIWWRVKNFLERKIPSTASLFNSFVTDRKWHDYKESLIAETLQGKQCANATTIHDVPYSVRLEEEIDI